MKIAGTILDPCTAFIMSGLLQELHDGITFRIGLSRFSFSARHCPTLPVLARYAQLGTHVYLGLISWRRLFACDSCQADSAVLAYRPTFHSIRRCFVYRVFLLRNLDGQGRPPPRASPS